MEGPGYCGSQPGAGPAPGGREEEVTSALPYHFPLSQMLCMDTDKHLRSEAAGLSPQDNGLTQEVKPRFLPWPLRRSGRGFAPFPSHRPLPGRSPSEARNKPAAAGRRGGSRRWNVLAAAA